MNTNGFHHDNLRAFDARASPVSSYGPEESEGIGGRLMSNKRPHHVTGSHLVVQTHHHHHVGHGPRGTHTSHSSHSTHSTHSTNRHHKPAFDSHFNAPGTIVDEPPSRNHSAGSKRDKSRGGSRRQSDLRKSVSADHERAQEHEKQVEGSGAMQLRNTHQTEKLKEAFRIFDRDGDGRITSAEMARVMQSLGYRPNEKEIDAMFDKADVNRNGTIEFDEFIHVLAEEFSEHNEAARRLSFDQDLLAIFEIFDVNKDGRITAQELNHAMLLLGEQLRPSELEDMMRTADTNGDGAIDFQEFQNLFRLGDQKFEAAMNKAALTRR